MRRTFTGFWWSPATEGGPALVVTVAFFALGAGTGCFLAFRASETSVDLMRAYLDRFLELARDGGLCAPDLPALVWKEIRWPLAAFLLGFSALGLPGIPLLSGLRGFFFAYSVASFARAYGQAGLMAAFLLLGIPALSTLPAFFLLCVQSFSASCVLAWRGFGQGKRDHPYHQEYFIRCGVCAAAIFAGFFLERYLVPGLFSDWAGTLLP